jgi:hypothetical protein
MEEGGEALAMVHNNLRIVNGLDFCSGLGNLAPATHVGSRQIGC